jgi:hypothetical protein
MKDNQDRDEVLSEVKQNGRAFEYVDESFKIDKEIVLAAVKQDGFNLYFADESLLKVARENVILAVKNSVIALKHADESLTKDREIVMAAVKQNGSALYFADETLKKDKEIVMAAVNQDAEALDYADESLKKDKDIIQLTLKQNDSEESLSYTLVGEELTYHSEIISKADLSSVEKIEKQIDDFIENSDSSSSSYPVIGFMENPEGSKLSGFISSTLEDSENNIIEYKIKNNGLLIDKPKQGEITFIYYYKYLSSSYSLVPLGSHKNVSFEINIFNNEAVIFTEQKQFEFESEEADKETETRLQILFDDGKNIEDTIDNKNNLITQINDYLAE